MQNHQLVLGGGWTVWRDVLLRSAGFPASWIDGLADPALARRVDEAIAAGAADDAAIAGAVADSQRAASRQLRALARDPVFREAVTWQNRRAIHRGIDSLLRQAEDRAGSKARQNEQLVASYTQRYCCKNERAGFFGAAAPARFVDDGPALTMHPGERLLARRATYLEPWAIDALAARLAGDPELRPELIPRRMPSIRLDGALLIHPGGTSELPPDLARLIAACDGETPARRIAEQRVAAADAGSVGEVYAALDELVAERVVVWTLEVPTTGGPPEQLLRAELERLSPTAARDRAFAALAELERARDQVSAAAGSSERVDAAIAGLERVFVEVTGQDSVRGAGEAYAGRTIVGEDCERDVDVALGPPLIERLSGPLQLVLHSARWYTHEIARRYRAAIGAVYRELAGDRAGPVDYARLYARLPELFPGPEAADSIVAQVGAALRGRWREVLGLDGSERQIRRTAGALRPAVHAAFAAPRPGWPLARYHSPDVLIAGDGVDAVNRGEFLAVLGEVHVGMNSLLGATVPNAEGDPDAPFALRDLDIGRPCVARVWSHRRSRLDHYSRSPRDLDVEVSTARSWRPRTQVLALADLVVDQAGRGLVVRTRDGRLAFDVIAFLEHYLLAASFSEFGLLAGPHTPRVVVDGVVLARERWVLAAADLGFAHDKDAARRFVRARRWARDAGIPRRWFLKIPEETKPIFVDLASPTFVDLAAKAMRKASRVAISEMLPDLDQLWLADADRRRYTSELRMVAVDPEPWLPE
jgi:hypothetical protein